LRLVGLVSLSVDEVVKVVLSSSREREDPLATLAALVERRQTNERLERIGDTHTHTQHAHMSHVPIPRNWPDVSVARLVTSITIDLGLAFGSSNVNTILIHNLLVGLDSEETRIRS